MLLSTDGNIAAIYMKEKGNFRAKKIKPPLVAAANREGLNHERILLKKGKSCKIGMQKIIRHYGYIILWIKRKNAQTYCETCNRDKFEQEKKHRHKKIENPKFVDKKTHCCYNINVT